MNISRKRKGSSEIPTASTSDIAFLLIIFFMATTKFDVKEGLTLVLPPAATESTQKVTLSQKNMTRIFVQPSGEIMWNETSLGPLNTQILDAKIREILKTNPNMIFTIKLDRESRYNDMVRVLDRLKSSGAQKISLSTN